MKSNPLKVIIPKGVRTELRTHRLRAGLSQSELGALLGYPSEVTVSRHETARSVPPLLIALIYEALFSVPVSHLFVGLKDQADLLVEKRLVQFEAELESIKSTQGVLSPDVAQKLAWLTDRRDLKDEFNA